MTVRATPVRPAAALDELARAVADAKGGDPLAPVSVVVPTNASGVTARRWLGRHGGVAAVDMLTLYRVAEVLAGPALAAAGRRPVSTPVIDIAIRAVLRDRPGSFRSVADHPSTIVALRELHRELRTAGPDAPNLLANASERGREAARISTRVADHLGDGWYDEGDLLRGSIERVAGGDVPASLHRVVVFLPHPLRGLDVALIEALATHHHVEILLAHTGDAEADDEMVTLGRRVDPAYRTDEVAALRTSDGSEIVSATDADDEVRHAVRAIVDAARDGVPFDRMALLWPIDRPYARLVEHHLDAAALPWNGRPGTAVAERVVPRFVLDLLDVDRRGLRRRGLFELLADVPVRDGSGQYVPTARWERVSRAAGVARDDDWGPRLRRYANREREFAAAQGLDESSRADDAERLLALVDDLRRTLGHRSATRTWADWADWTERQIVFRLGKSFVDALDVAERQAWDHTNRVLDRLRSLDAISEPVRRSEFRAAFAAEFDLAPGRLGRIGVGVTIGSLASAAGLDVDLAIVLGAADGAMPPAPSSGPLVGDAERLAAGLAPAASAGARLHRQLRSVLDVAPRSIVLYPRGDLRATSDRQPSRWLDSILAGVPVRHLASHHAALLATPFPAALAEHRIRGRLAVAESDRVLTEDTGGVRGDIVLHRALTMRSARRSHEITVFDGDLSSVTIDHFARPVAPTQIEQWVSCPHGYFARYLLGVRPVDEPGDETQISASERGNLIHRTLDLFHREVIAGALPQPEGGWNDAHARRLAELFEQVADEFESSGRTGREASWWVERLGVWSEIVGWLERDGAHLAAHPAAIVSSEQRFGDDGSVSLPLADDRRLLVRGDIDRVDRRADGTLLVVDHKTGRPDSFNAIADDDPTAGASRFQLPVYAAGAWSIAGEQLPVRAEYSFFARGNYRRIGYDFAEPVWDVVSRDLTEVVEGIESGLFPNRPDVPGYQFYVNCYYCQPDELGTAERWPEWDRKRDDPRGARWFAEPDEDDPATGEAS